MNKYKIKMENDLYQIYRFLSDKYEHLKPSIKLGDDYFEVYLKGYLGDEILITPNYNEPKLVVKTIGPNPSSLETKELISIIESEIKELTNIKEIK